MRKIIVSIIGLMFLAGVAVASVNVLDNGTNKGPAQDINFVGATVTDNGASKTVSVNAISGNLDVSGTFAAGTADAFTVGATGTIIDTSLYAATQGVGGNRTVCVSADGKIFSSATACP